MPVEEVKNSLELFIETDKLHSVKRSMEKFLNKWTKRKLNKLQIPQQFEKYRKSFIALQWVNRFTLAGAGVLTLNGYQKIGGTISIFFPLVDLLGLTLRDRNEMKKREWEEFVKDTEGLGNDFDELTTIVNSIKSKNFPSEKLNDKIYNFLKDYDKNEDRVIDVYELEIEKFARDLKRNWKIGKEREMRKIIWEIQNLQKEVINYQHRL